MEREMQLSLEEHPVSAEMKLRVLEELKAIEATYQVKVLYACESGSRGWGFASPDSDYDVRFIYVHRPEWYLQVETARDVIERPLDDELDISGWELRKALQLLKGANPTLLEWLDSPIVYYAEPVFYQRLRKLSQECFSEVRARYHYLSMAKKNFRGYLQGDTVRLKKYLYVLRPILAARWIEQGLGQPPMRFSQLLTIVEDKLLLAEIDSLLQRKRRAGEAEYADRLSLLHQFIEMELEHRLSVDEKMLKNAEGCPTLELDRLLYETVMAISKD